MSNNPNQVPPPSGPGGYGSPGAMAMQPEHPQGTTILVLGILSLVCCSLLGPVAWYMGNKARNEVKASPNGYSNSNLITIGWICGIIGTVFLVLGIIYFIFVVVIVGAGSTG